MSDQSKDAAIHSKKQLENILSSIHRMNDTVQQIAMISQEHSHGLEELNTSFEHIAQTAQSI